MIGFKTIFSRRELLWFGPLFALFAGFIGWISVWKFDARPVAIWVWAIGGGVIVLYYLIPALRRAIFMAWLGMVFPIGWLLSHALLSVVFYLVVLPIGLMLRLFRYDALHRRFDPKAPSYWIKRSSSTEPKRYFRQF